MINKGPGFTTYLGKVAKWLFKATLLISLSAFSLSAYHTQETPAEVAKTELVVTDNIGVRPHTPYQPGFTKTFKNRCNSGFYQFTNTKTSLISKCLFKIAFKSGSRQFFSFRQFRRFRPQKTIPQSSNEGPHYLFIG